MSNVLFTFTIYAHPRDYPAGYMVRCWAVFPGAPEPRPQAAMVATSLEAARGLVPRGLYRLPREPTDDPCIVETWI